MVQLSVALTGDGTGSLSGVNGLTCAPNECRVQLPAGEHLTLRATPDAASVIGGWTGASCAGEACELAVEADLRLAVRFDRKPRPPAGLLCGGGGPPCVVLADEVIPDSAGLRNTEALGFELDSADRPIVFSAYTASTCGSAIPPQYAVGFKAVRSEGRWQTSGQILDLSISLAAAGSDRALGILSEGFFALSFSIERNGSWVRSDAPPFAATFPGAFAGDRNGRFQAIGYRDGTPVHATWAGSWTWTPVVVPPTRIGLVSTEPGTTVISLRVAPGGEPRIARWSRDGVIDTLMVGDPDLPQEAAVTGAATMQHTPIGFALTQPVVGAEPIPHVLAPRLSAVNGAATIDPPGAAREIVYATKARGAWRVDTLAAAAPKEDCTGNGCVTDKWTYTAIGVAAAPDGDVRLLYRANHLTGTLVTVCQRAGCYTTGGHVTNDLMLAWIEGDEVRQVRIADGSAEPSTWFGPLGRVAVDRKGRIHAISEQFAACGASLRYLLIGPQQL